MQTSKYIVQGGESEGQSRVLEISLCDTCLDSIRGQQSAYVWTTYIQI